jgi:hypothetical protein
MAANPNYLVLAYNYIDRIELFRFNAPEQTVEPFLVIGSDRDQSDRDGDSYVEYYTSLHCDDRHIYALHQQGQNPEDGKNSVMEIYTLTGEAVIKVILDRYIDTFALDSRTNCIYGTNHMRDFDFVYVYKLSDFSI